MKSKRHSYCRRYIVQSGEHVSSEEAYRAWRRAHWRMGMCIVIIDV